MNAWERQRALARTTTAWAAASIVGGGVLAVSRDPWRRSSGLQHVGWGLVDLGIIAAATGVQARRMRRLGNAFTPAALESERRHLRTVLLVNVVADAGYVAVGGALWRRPRPKVSGAGAAVVIQGSFLLLLDGYHALASTR